jgi:hypothetical protein
MPIGTEVTDNGESAFRSAEDAPTKKPSKTKILKDFKEDMKSADSLRLEMVAKVETWRDHYNGAPYGNEQVGKSEIVSRDIKRQDEWQHASLKDPFVADQDIIKANPVTYEDRPAAEQNQLILNQQFCRQFNRYKFMTDVIKLHYSEGTVIVKTSWDYEDEEIEEEVPIYGLDLSGQPMVIDTKVVKRIKVLINKPHAQVCRLEDIFLDPTSEGDINKAQFVIHRYESDLSTLRKAGKYKNLNKLARNIAGKNDSAAFDTEDYDPEDETEFSFVDEPRKKIVIYEYWGNYDVDGDGIAEPVVCTWANDIILQLESNPYPDEEIPFLILMNNSTPFKVYGEADAELVGDNQKVSTAIKRGIIDNMANSNNAQKGMRVGSMDAINKKRFLNGKNFEFNGSQGDFYEGGYNAIPQSVFAVLEHTNNETESMLGVKAFTSGIQGASLGSTARAASGVLDAVSVRRLDIVRNIAENLIKPLMRKWMAYNSEFLSEQEVVRITNQEFVEIKRDDLKGQIDIEIEVSTAEDNDAKAQKLSFLLQTLGQEMDQGMRNMLMGQIAKLTRLPDLAEEIENYEPQPDPFVEQMKQLELEKMQVEIMERKSRAMENEVDMINKMTQAKLNEARTKDLLSNADLKDLDFARKADGTEHAENMDKETLKSDTALEGKQMDNFTKHTIASEKPAAKAN